MCKLSLMQFINQIKLTSQVHKWKVATPVDSIPDAKLELIIFGAVIVLCHSHERTIHIAHINSILYDRNSIKYKLYCADGVYTLSIGD